jgi:FMN phosphatase YigB (HAD superfamily)
MKKKNKLGLITFDLDDTLYPIAPVLDEANTAFSTAMSNFGYVDIAPSDIVEAGKIIRSQVTEDKEGAGVDPLKPATVNHKEIRLAAIRKEMEQFILRTKLKQTAADWATDVEDLTSPVKKSAEK